MLSGIFCFLHSDFDIRHSEFRGGGIAQLVERQLCKLDVRGSNPLASSLRSRRRGERRLSRRSLWRRRTVSPWSHEIARASTRQASSRRRGERRLSRRSLWRRRTVSPWSHEIVRASTRQASSRRRGERRLSRRSISVGGPFSFLPGRIARATARQATVAPFQLATRTQRASTWRTPRCITSTSSRVKSTKNDSTQD